KRARPMHPDWPRQLRDDCQAAGVPFYFKQWGSWSPDKPLNFSQLSRRRWLHQTVTFNSKGDSYRSTEPDMLLQPDMVTMYKTSKCRSGRLLDGVIHDEMPADR